MRDGKVTRVTFENVPAFAVHLGTQQPGQIAPGQPVVAFVSSVVQVWFIRDPLAHVLSSFEPGGQVRAAVRAAERRDAR